MPPTPPPDRMVLDMSMPPSDTTEDTATLLRDLNRPEGTPPHATSTPMRSLQMTAQFQAQSNLLDGDSEMQRALGGMDSYEGDSVPNGRPRECEVQRASIICLIQRRVVSAQATQRRGSFTCETTVVDIAL